MADYIRVDYFSKTACPKVLSVKTYAKAAVNSAVFLETNQAKKVQFVI